MSDSYKSELVYEISSRDCDAVCGVFIGELAVVWRLETRAYGSCERNGPKTSALCQQVANCDHFTVWDDAEILKMELNYSKRRMAEC